MTAKRWEHQIEKQVFDALNELETDAGHPIPPAVRAGMHAAITAHVTKLQSAQKRRRLAAVGTLAGWLAVVILIPAPTFWLAVVKSFLLVSTGLNAFWLGRRHEQVKTLEGQMVGIHFVPRSDDE